MTIFPAEYDHAKGVLQDYCPKCKGKNLKTGNTLTTLLAWTGGPEKNPNEHVCEIQCLDCDYEYTLRWVPANKKAWITETVKWPPTETY